MCYMVKVLLALISRTLFIIHGVVTVWHVVQVRGPFYWVLASGVSLLVIEMAITLKITRNGEWKWFSPMVFLYLSSVVPSIWYLELDLVQAHQRAHSLSISPVNIPLFDQSTHITKAFNGLDAEIWVAGLEQTMLIVLVIGRWLMPKGDMSRDQLSQLLLVYVGLGADILDIFDTFKEPEVNENKMVVIVGLGLFTWALMQFPLVLTHKSTNARISRGRIVCCTDAKSCLISLCPSEVWSLLLTVGFQDGPFMFYRVYLMVEEKVLNQLMIYFTCKNILIVLIEIYRMFVVKWEHQAAQGEGEFELCGSMCCRKSSRQVEEGLQEYRVEDSEFEEEQRRWAERGVWDGEDESIQEEDWENDLDRGSRAGEVVEEEEQAGQGPQERRGEREGGEGRRAGTGGTEDTGEEGGEGRRAGTGGAEGTGGEVGEGGRAGTGGTSATGEEGGEGRRAGTGGTSVKGEEGDEGRRAGTVETRATGEEGDEGRRAGTGETRATGEEGDEGRRAGTGETRATGEEGDEGRRAGTGETRATGEEGGEGRRAGTGGTSVKGEEGEEGRRAGTGGTRATGEEGGEGRRAGTGGTEDTGGEGGKARRAGKGGTGATGGESGESRRAGTGGTGATGWEWGEGRRAGTGGSEGTGGTGCTESLRLELQLQEKECEPNHASAVFLDNCP
nr:keratin, type I cytoskeletal 9 [Nerophis lumbriciformis]